MCIKLVVFIMYLRHYDAGQQNIKLHLEIRMGYDAVS
jgi:hypothetical protein